MRLSRRQLIAVAAVAVLLSVYAALGFLAVPRIVRGVAGDLVRSHYGRTLSIGDIRFNPFTLNLDVTRVALPDADGQTMLAFERLHVGLQLASLWRLGPSFSEILLEHPYVRAVLRPDKALNLADLGKDLAPAPPQPPKKSAPVRLYIGRLAVVGGTTSFEDRTRPSPFRADFQPIAFELHDFSTTAATGDAYTLHAISPQGALLDWSGTLHLEPVASQGRFSITEVKAQKVWSYLSAILPFEIDSGVIALNGDYDLSATAAGPLGFKLNVRAATVSGLGVRPQGGSEDYVSLARIEVDDTRVDFGRHAVDVAKVQLSGGEIKAWLGEQGRLNLLELAGGPAPAGPSGQPASDAPVPAAPAPAAPGAAASAWTVSVPDISVESLKVTAEDRQAQPVATVVLDPLNVHVAGFNLAPDDVVDIQLDTAVNSSGKVSARAQAAPRSGGVTAHVEAERVPLTALQPLLARYTSMTLLKGELGTRLDIERGADGSLGVKGDTRIADLSTVDNALQKDFIRWKDLRIKSVNFRSQPASLRIGSVTALEPYVRMIIAPDRSVNITQVLTAPGAKPPAAAPTTSAAPVAASAPPAPKARSRKGKLSAASPAAAPAAPLTPFPVSIGAFRMVNGSADYTDLWIKPSFSLGMQALNGAVTRLSSDPASRAKVQLDGKLASYSPLHIAGEVNLLSAALYTDITLSFKDLDLPIVNPYSGYFVGYKIDKGKLSVDVSYEIEERKLNASQHFVVDQLELGDPVESPEAVHLPLKIAVALLKDRNGVIDLPLPMSGSLDDPEFRIGPIVWKMFVNLIGKIVTAPFALLGHLFGGGEHPNIVEFAAGSAVLSPPAQDQLAALSKALKERPQLKLDVPIVASAGIDRPQLARERLHAALVARVAASRAGRKNPEEAAELTLADPDKHLQLLIEEFRARLGKDAALPASVAAVQAAKKGEIPDVDAAVADLEAALVNHIEVPDSDLDALGRARAQGIQTALLAGGQIDPARVFIVNAAPKPDSGDTVKVELAVH
ncbi:MAG TPA: DUF748 domain-containing protein [Steroidobacteraceae bacterium]|nr:DUF748 domain-containing protein [Steroidobacteraceae bacterium]